MSRPRKARKGQKKRKTVERPREKPRLPGDLSQEELMARLLRVDHAGEFGAQRIYKGQLAILGDSAVGDELRHMAEQEEEHLRVFSALLSERQVRPTILHPLWHVAGYALGMGTALLGEKAAMACTVAVEEVIDEHYARQLAALDGDEDALSEIIARFRQEEIEHKDIAKTHGAEDLPYYPLLRGLIRAGSLTAIWLSERF